MTGRCDVRDGALQEKPLLDASVAHAGEQGMLGIAAVDSKVYIYLSESTADGAGAVGRRVYRYDWTGAALVNPALVKDMNSTQTYHNGGGMAVRPDGTVYLAVGDAGRYGQLQNHGNDFYPDTSVIMPIAPAGPYYAMGVRNSFGLAFDPFTGNMWDTENGPDSFDEINLVKPYTNSGWDVIMGSANATLIARLPEYKNYTYSDPEFSWEKTVAPTALTFVRSEPLSKFNDSLFVADCNTGNLYRFRLNESRDSLVFGSPQLSDGVANVGDSQDEIIFGTGFGCMTDLEVGPDGLLYLISMSEGKIFRMVPRALASTGQLARPDMSLAFYPAIAAAAGASIYAFRRNRRRP